MNSVPDTTASGTTHPDSPAPLRLPVMEEQVSVQREVVETGVLRIRKQVHEETKQIQIALLSEVVETRRVEIDRIVDAPQPPYQDGDEWVVPIHEEVLIRQLVLKAELRITRRQHVRQEDQTVTLRREEVISERIDSETGTTQAI